MERRVLILVAILITASLLLWVPVKSSMADAERFFTTKIMEKIDKVLANQKKILDELKLLKAGVAPIQRR